MAFNFFVDNSSPWIGFWGNVVGAFLAGVIAIFVMCKTTKQTREIQEESRKNSVKPILIFFGTDKNTRVISAELCGNFFGVSVKDLRNIGNGCAFDIEVESSPGLELDKCKIPKMLIKDAAVELRLHSEVIYNLKDDETFKVSLKYKDMFNNGYSTEYIIKREKNHWTEISCSVK